MDSIIRMLKSYNELKHKLTFGLAPLGNRTEEAPALRGGAVEKRTHYVLFPDSSRTIPIDDGGQCRLSRPAEMTYSAYPAEPGKPAHEVADMIGWGAYLHTEQRPGEDPSGSPIAAAYRMAQMGVTCSNAEGQPIVPRLTPKEIDRLGQEQVRQ